MSERQEKVSREVQRLVSEYIQERSNKSSMITVMRSSISRDLKNARILVSVFPEEKEQEAIEFLERSTSDARQHLKKHGSFKNAPHLTFEIDRGEKHRQRLDEISP